MSDLIVMRGEYGFYVSGTITNDDGSVFNLTGYNLTFNAWDKGSWKHPFVSATAEAVIATQGTWRYLVADGDFVSPGDGKLVIVSCTKAGAEEKTEQYTLDVKEAP